MSRQSRKDRRRERREKRGGKTRIGKLFQNIGKGAKEIIGKVKEGTLFVSLLPFAIPMAVILKTKGVKPDKNIGKLAQQFYNSIILKQSTFETYEPEHLAGALVAEIVKGVIGFFKAMKKKKDSGETLTAAEEKAVDIADKAVEEVITPVSDSVKEEASKEAKSTLFIPIIVIAIAVIALLYFSKSKKK